MSAPTIESQRIVEFCQGIVDVGQLAIGVQLAVRHQGIEQVLTLGVGGTGRPLTPESQLRMYCAGKPVVAVGLLRPLVGVGVDLDEPVGPRLGTRLDGFPDTVGRYTFRQLLCHATSLTRPVGKQVVRVPDSMIPGLIRDGAHETIGGDPSYSEIAAWRLLCWAAEEVLGRPAPDQLRDEIRGTFGLDRTAFVMDDEEVERSSVEPNVSLRHDERIPMLSEASPSRLRWFDPGVGCISTASDLSRFYEWTMAPTAGSDGEDASTLLEAMTTFRRPVQFEPAFKRECTFGLGFMVDLESHLFGRRVGPRAYGHSGLMGTAFGFADPDADLAVGGVFVGITDEESALDYLRPTVVDLIYRELV